MAARAILDPSTPVIAAVDGSSASTAAVDTAVRLGAELDAPVVFVHVRRGPWSILGEPLYQRRVTARIARGRRALDAALDTAAGAGVVAEGEILEGSPRRRILEFARDRGARLIVVGSRPRKLGRSVSSAVVRASDRAVVVAHARPSRASAAGEAA